MDKKKDHNHKFAATTCQEANENAPLLGKDDQNHCDAVQNTTTAPLNQQLPLLVQLPNTAKPDVEQPSLISKPCIPNQLPSPVILSGWQQSQNQLPNPTFLQLQHGQPSAHLAQPTMPFWLAQQPGFHIPGANVPASYQPFSPVGTTDVTWPSFGVSGGGIAARNQPQAPSFCYPYPGFPGPWDPSSWWGQLQQSLPLTHNSPGACSYYPALPLPLPGCSAVSAPSPEKGIIRPAAKLSHKHQQLWEAQSAENVQLWNAVGQLKSELADYKNRLAKLEANALQLKPTAEEPAARVASLAGHTSKRGRPKKPGAQNDVLPNPNESLPRVRRRKSALPNSQSETKLLYFEKESQKVEDIAQIQQANDGNTVFSISSQQVKESETKTGSATYMGINNGSFIWPSVISTNNGRDSMNIRPSFYGDFSATGNGQNVVAGWSFGDDEDASVGLENAAVESGKDEGEEIEDNCSSGAEDIA